MGKSQPTYTREFKQQAVQLFETKGNRMTNSPHGFPIAPNLLKRDCTADAANKKWVADMTFMET